MATQIPSLMSRTCGHGGLQHVQQLLAELLEVQVSKHTKRTKRLALRLAIWRVASLQNKRMASIPRHETALNAGSSGFVSFPCLPTTAIAGPDQSDPGARLCPKEVRWMRHEPVLRSGAQHVRMINHPTQRCTNGRGGEAPFATRDLASDTDCQSLTHATRVLRTWPFRSKIVSNSIALGSSPPNAQLLGSLGCF